MKTLKQFIDEIKQKYDSKDTSRNQVPEGIGLIRKHFGWEQGSYNLDYGGGKYSKATKELLEKDGVINLVYDKYHNNDKSVLAEADMKAKTTTCFNVLNVIMEDDIRREVIRECGRKRTERIFFTVHVDPKKEAGVSNKKGTTWQNHKVLADYLPEVKSVYSSAYIKYKMIIVDL